MSKKIAKIIPGRRDEQEKKSGCPGCENNCFAVFLQ